MHRTILQCGGTHHLDAWLLATVFRIYYINDSLNKLSVYRLLLGLLLLLRRLEEIITLVHVFIAFFYELSEIRVA